MTSRIVNTKSVKSAIRTAREDRSSKTFQFPEDLGQHGILLIFKKYSFQPPGTRRLITRADAVEEVGDQVYLPLPTNIADSYSMRIGRPELGIVGEVAATAAAASSSSTGGIGGAIGSAYDAIRNLGINENQARDLITSGSSSEISENLKFLLRAAVPGNMGSAIDQGLGSTINPKMSLSFDGVDLKTHNFDWRFMVRSPNESMALRNIQNTVRRNIHPTYANAGGHIRAMLRYPSVVDVCFVGLDSDYFMYFKTCMVQSFSLNFTPDAVSIIQSGRPAGAMMSIQLVETDIHTAEDYGAAQETIDVEMGDDVFMPTDNPTRTTLPETTEV